MVIQCCSFCQFDRFGHVVKELIYSGLLICNHCTRDVSISDVYEKLKHKPELIYSLTIKEITDDNTFREPNKVVRRKIKSPKDDKRRTESG